MIDKLLLVIDGYNLYIRNFVANPTLDVNGERSGGIVGTLQSLGKLLGEFKPTQCVVVWDGEGGSAKRRSIYNEYKSGRRVRLNGEDFGGDAKRHLENMRHQRQITSECLNTLGIPQVRCADVEADDLIAYIVGSLNTERSVVVSTDKDFLQLIDGERVRVYSPIKKKMYSSDVFRAEFGVMPENYAIMKSLVGDGSDNIEGIRGFGVKTVAKTFPFLNERISSMSEVLNEALREKSKACKTLVERSDRAIENMKLMDLSLDNISASAARDGRAAADACLPVREVEFMLKLQREGVSMANDRFMQPYKELAVRRKKTLRPGVES